MREEFEVGLGCCRLAHERLGRIGKNWESVSRAGRTMIGESMEEENVCFWWGCGLKLS